MQFRFPLKFLIPISTAVILSAGFLIWHATPQEGPAPNLSTSPASPASQGGQVDMSLPSEIALSEGEVIPLNWTDENQGENLIIKSDEQAYYGEGTVEVYFSITNQSGKDQNLDIYFWFDEKGKFVESAEKIDSNGILNFKFPILNEFSMPEFSNRKDTKGYTAGSKFQDEIKAGQANFYKALIGFPEAEGGEFFIEVFGDKGGYGHLDPLIRADCMQLTNN